MSYTFEYDGNPHGGAIHDEDGLEIADHVAPGDGPLLAAAPDLLAALQTLMGLIGMTGPRRIADFKIPIERAREAIAKAEGAA